MVSTDLEKAKAKSSHAKHLYPDVPAQLGSASKSGGHNEKDQQMSAGKRRETAGNSNATTASESSRRLPSARDQHAASKALKKQGPPLEVKLTRNKMTRNTPRETHDRVLFQGSASQPFEVPTY